MNRNVLIACCSVVTCMLSFATVQAQEFDEQYSHWPEKLKINGHILINNGVKDFESARSFLQRVVRKKNIVCFEPDLPSSDTPANALVAELRAGTADEGHLTIVRSNRPPIELLKTALGTADAVSIHLAGEQVTSLAELTGEFSDFVARGGILFVGASLAERLSEFYLRSPDLGSGESAPEEEEKKTPSDASSEEDEPLQTVVGMRLLPDCLLRCLGRDEKLSPEEVLPALSKRPRTVGIVLEPATMLVLSGRKMYCFGEGKATFCLPSTEHLEARVESIVEPNGRQRAPWDSLIDLTEWRRDAIDRTIAPFPPAMPRTPHVKRGSLLIVGGGGMPSGLMDRFIELAGGLEKAKLVYVPCSEAESVGDRQRTVESWRKMGVQHATFIHTKDRHQANRDEAFLEPLRDATGIWFGGGRQWNFADSYYGTTAHKLMKDVLLRGGVIGGSSAGASIQARYLARATPIGNTRIMAPGYERGGLGFISGVAIDQHFSQRGRQKDMTQLMGRHPQLLGIGLDEATAIEVQQSQAKVVGRGRAFFYNREIPVKADEPDYVALPAGSIYDLAKRTILVDATNASPGGDKEKTDNDAKPKDEAAKR